MFKLSVFEKYQTEFRLRIRDNKKAVSTYTNTYETIQLPESMVNSFIESAVLEGIFTLIKSRVKNSKEEKHKYFWSM
jgi:hypothetical protein